MTWLKWTTLLFFISLLLDLLFISLDQPHMRWISKPLLMLVLIVSLFTIRRRINKSHYATWMAALVFSWFGDLFLMGGQSFFIPGLFAFLCAHISYTLLFYRIKPTSVLMKGPFTFTILLTIVYFISFYRVILIKTGGLFPAVLIYALVILVMWLVASHRSFRQNQQNIWLWSGALLFVVSDTLLGYNKFVQFVPLINGLVMLTYGLAQYGIFRGVFKMMKTET